MKPSDCQPIYVGSRTCRRTDPEHHVEYARHLKRAMDEKSELVTKLRDIWRRAEEAMTQALKLTAEARELEVTVTGLPCVHGGGGRFEA